MAEVKCGLVLGRAWVPGFASVFFTTCGTKAFQTELGMCWVARLRAGSTVLVCPPLGLDMPCPPEHGLLSQLLLIIFMNSTVRGQLGLPVLREKALCSVCPLAVTLAQDCGFQYSQEQQRPVQLTLSGCATATKASWGSGSVPRVFTDKKTRPLVDPEKSLGAHKDSYFCPSSGPVDRHRELCQVSLTTRLYRAADRGHDPWTQRG